MPSCLTPNDKLFLKTHKKRNSRPKFKKKTIKEQSGEKQNFIRGNNWVEKNIYITEEQTYI